MWIMLELWNISYSTHKNKFKVENEFSNSGGVELGEFGFYNSPSMGIRVLSHENEFLS